MNNTEPTETKQRQRAPLREFPDWEGTPAQWLDASIQKQPNTEWLKLDWRDVSELDQASITLAAIRHLTPQNSHEYFGGQDRAAKLTGLVDSTTVKHFADLVRSKRLSEVVSPRFCKTYKLSRTQPSNDFGILPIGYLRIIENFADRCLFALALSNTYKIMEVKTVNDRLDLDDAIINHGFSLAKVSGTRWRLLTGLDPKTLRRSRDKLVEQRLIVRSGDSIWVSDEF